MWTVNPHYLPSFHRNVIIINISTRLENNGLIGLIGLIGPMREPKKHTVGAHFSLTNRRGERESGISLPPPSPPLSPTIQLLPWQRSVYTTCFLLAEALVSCHRVFITWVRSSEKEHTSWQKESNLTVKNFIQTRGYINIATNRETEGPKTKCGSKRR